MAVLSNNGRLIVSLPLATQLQDSDQLIVQSVSGVNPNGITQRVNYKFVRDDLSQLIIDDIQNTPTLKFSGSFFNPNGTVANFYTTRIRNGLTVTGASTFQSVTATQFNGPLNGNVNAASILVSGTGNFGTIIVANTIAGNINSSGLSTFANVQIAGGIIGGLPGAITINNTPIGDTAPSTIKGTQITASTAIKSLGSLVVDTNSRFGGQVTVNTITGSTIIVNKITGSKSITGSLFGKLTGDIFSPTGVKVLENGTGVAKLSQFYGSSSYAFTSSQALTSSYALFALSTANTVNFVNFSLSSSYASSSRYANFSLSSSYASSSRYSRFSLSSSYASSSRYSRFSLSSSYASSSKFSNFNLSSSYASSSNFSNNSIFSLSSSYASSSYTASYILQTPNIPNNSIPFYNGTALVPASQFNFYPYGSALILKLSGSYDNSYLFNQNVLTIESPKSGLYSSQFILSNNIRHGRNFHSTFANDYAAGGGPEAWKFMVHDSGSFSLQSYWESYNFTSSNYVNKLNNAAKNSSTFYFAKIIKNDLYLWGEPYSYHSSMRDGAVGIGIVQPSNQTQNRTTKARLHINVFSSSIDQLGTGQWNGSGTVRNLPALLVTYGSGSTATPFEKTFYVSGSGNTYIGGTLTSSADVYIAGDLKVDGNLTYNSSGNGSTFNFIYPSVLLETVTYLTDNSWITIDTSAYPDAKSLILFVQIDTNNITYGQTQTTTVLARKNSSTEAAGRRIAHCTATSPFNNPNNYGNGSQAIVPVDTVAQSFDINVNSDADFNFKGTHTTTITLLGYLT